MESTENKGGLMVPTETKERKVSVLETLTITPFAQHSLSHYLTRERLPAANLYSKSANQKRLSVGELLSNEQPVTVESGEPIQEGSSLQLGWIRGVFIKCLLNIWGVMLFLRLSWVVGQAGLIEGILIITLANVVTFLTGLSMSAVSTNGRIKGGGIYYMLSRSLGAEFGGAIGLLIVTANSIATAMYVVGFCESLLDMLMQYGAITEYFLNSRLNDIRVIGSGTMVVILILAVVGLEWVNRVELALLVLLIAAQVDFIAGSFLKPTDEEKASGFVGYSIGTLKENLWGYYEGDGQGKTVDFIAVFSVFFPAVTGIAAGANFSGDLRDPAYAIPRGSLGAVITTYTSYIIYAIMVAGCSIRQASGIVGEIDFDPNNSTFNQTFDNCTGRVCEKGSAVDQQLIELISAWGPLIYAGCFAATLSSAIASLVGAPRVFQAVAKDKLFPGISMFAKGRGKNNDPFNGYILVFIVALACVIIGDLNMISSLLSNFFIASYAMINFAVFHASITRSPGWRPSFKYYNKWVSLAGCILCIAVMCWMEAVTAMVTFALVILLYVWIRSRKVDANWGSSTQAQAFTSALSSLVTLSKTEDHVKNYRPKIAVMSGNPESRSSLIDFANQLTKKVSLLMCVNLVKDEELAWKDKEEMKRVGAHWLGEQGIKAFYSVTSSKSLHEGALAVLDLIGIDKMSPNMVLLGFKNDWSKKPEECQDFFDTLSTVFEHRLALGVLRVENKPTSNKDEPIERPFQSKQEMFKGNIDVYWLYDDGGLTLLLPHILSTRKLFKKSKMRVFFFSNSMDNLDQASRNMAELLAKFRIDWDDIMIISDANKTPTNETTREFKQMVRASNCDINDDILKEHSEKINFNLRIAEIVKENSEAAQLVVMTLPVPKRDSMPASLYLSILDYTTQQMPPFFFVRGNQESCLTFYS